MKIPGDPLPGFFFAFAGAMELIPFGANLDLPWDWIFLDIILGGSSLLSPVGVYYASPFVGNYKSPYYAKP